MSESFTERAVMLGSRQSLVGILARPARSSLPDAPAIVILNTGVVHRVGHHRMYVTMARQLASAGYQVLRFDFSGIGDSSPRADQLSPVNSCLADIAEVLDSLEKDHQVKSVVLIGLCSGADHAVLYAHRDSRIVGMVLMDPSIPPTARYYFHYIAQRLIRLQNWISVATLRSGLLKRLITQAMYSVLPQSQPDKLTLEALQHSPYLGQCYRSAVRRGAKILAVFSAISPRSTYPQQMRDAFRGVEFGNALKLEFLPESDHLFTAGRDRARLGTVITDWLAAKSPT
ncbi:MAG: alpha/beta fold hydrolase [Gammaproteobacteria bacterium]